MKKRAGVRWFALVLLVLLIGAVVLQSQVVHEIRERQARARTAIGPALHTEVVEPVTLESPYAILVLDVSGSMKQSDPQHMQSTAVHEFFHIYRRLSREVVGRGSAAKVAVVLFSTVAQTIDWGGEAGPWLSATEENEARFSRVIDGYLGNDGVEPRTGGNTDYLAALIEVQRLAGPLPTAPTVVFMTDGEYEPNPLFTPDYELDNRRAHSAAQFDQNRDVIARVIEGRMRLLDGTAAQLPVIFSGTPGSTAVKFTPEELAARAEKVRGVGAGLFGRRYGGRAMEWSVVFLNTAATPEQVDNARALLAGPDPSTFSNCSRAGDMVDAYVRSLTRWFGLRQGELREPSFQAPPQTEALAIQVSTDPSATGVQLICDSQVTPLNGRDGEWTGVVARPGRCEIHVDGGKFRGGHLYAKPRFDWVLGYPRNVLVGNKAADVPIDVQLYSLKEHRAVDAKLYSDLPESLPLSLRYPSGKPERQIALPRVHTVVDGKPVEYRVELRANDLLPELTTVYVDLAKLKDKSAFSSLSGSMDLSASVAPIFTDSRNQETAIHVTGLPVHGQTVARLIRRLRGE